MKIILAAENLLLTAFVAFMAGAYLSSTTSPVNYKVSPMNSREVFVLCTNGAQPLVSMSEENPRLVQVKCQDVAPVKY